MRPLGIPPNKNQLGDQFTTDFLKNLADRHKVYSGSANPTASQIPQGEWVLWKNTTAGEVRLWLNDGGTLRNVLLNTNTVQPAFSAYQNVAQAMGAGAFTKIVLDTEQYDYGNYFDSTTNYRFQPLVPGIYHFAGAVNVSTTPCQVLSMVYKNGAEFKRGMNNGSAANSAVSAYISMNGTTDYVELFGYFSTAQNTFANQAYTYFQGAWIRPL